MDRIIALINTLFKTKILTNRYILTMILVFMLGYSVPSFLDKYSKNLAKSIIQTEMSTSIKEMIKAELTSVLDARQQKREDTHNELINYSLEIAPKIDQKLSMLQNNIQSTRTFFCEYGNSLTSLSGLPFTYFTMRNEQNASGVKGVKQQYQQQSVDNFRFNYVLKKDKIYTLLNVNEIKESDPIFYTMLKKNGINQVYIYLLEVNNIPKGFVGVTYSGISEYSHDAIFYNLTVTAREIIGLLNEADKIKSQG